MKIWIELLSWLISVSSVCLWLTKSKNPHCLGTTTPPPTTATTMLNNLSVLYANWTLANWCCAMLKIHYDIHLEVRGTSVLQLDPFTLKDPPAIQAIWSDIRVNVNCCSINATASLLFLQFSSLGPQGLLVQVVSVPKIENSFFFSSVLPPPLLPKPNNILHSRTWL